MAPTSAENKHPSLCFFRETNHILPPNAGVERPGKNSQRRRPLRILPDVSGYSTVFLPGESASFIFKTSTSSPHMMRLRGESVRAISSFDSIAIGCDKGFAYLDSTVITICHIPFACRLAKCFIGHHSNMPAASRNPV